MATWYKQGVFGRLQPEASEGLRITEKVYASCREELYITSLQEGTHSVGTLHTDGRAWDMRKGNVKKEVLQKALGDDFDVVDESNHRHVEYDPKKKG